MKKGIRRISFREPVRRTNSSAPIITGVIGVALGALAMFGAYNFNDWVRSENLAADARLYGNDVRDVHQNYMRGGNSLDAFMRGNKECFTRDLPNLPASKTGKILIYCMPAKLQR